MSKEELDALAVAFNAEIDNRRKTGPSPTHTSIGNCPIKHPKHVVFAYASRPLDVEYIERADLMGLSLGNAVKCIRRANLNHNAIEDIERAIWYLNQEIKLRKDRDECQA